MRRKADVDENNVKMVVQDKQECCGRLKKYSDLFSMFVIILSIKKNVALLQFQAYFRSG